MSDKPSKPRVVAFEGVDGAGKSTVINIVAEHLRRQGIPVFLPRTGKEHSSRPTRMIRRLTRDRCNLALEAMPELLLYAAREAQVLGEQVRPAIARRSPRWARRAVRQARVRKLPRTCRSLS